MNHESKIGEAVASLTARQEARDVAVANGEDIESAATFATTYVNDMLRAGWRPVAPAATPPPTGQRCPDPAPYMQAAREAVAFARRSHQETPVTNPAKETSA